MLRDQKSLAASPKAWMQVGRIAILMTSGLALVGRHGTAADRKPAARSVARVIQTAQRADKKKPAPAKAADPHSKPAPFSLAFVPRDAIMVAAVRPAELLKRPVLAAVAKSISEQGGFKQELGIAIDRIEQVTVV